MSEYRRKRYRTACIFLGLFAASTAASYLGARLGHPPLALAGGLGMIIFAPMFISALPRD